MFEKPLQPVSWLLGIVVGWPGVPVGSWRVQCERSKFPPGEQVGFRARVEVREDKMKRSLKVEDGKVGILMGG